MPFGAIDYRQLDRTGQNLSNFSNTAFRNDQMKLQVEQDQADRAIAEQGSKVFNDIAFGTGEQREFGQPTKGTGIGEVASGTAPSGSNVHDPEAVFRAAAQAGEILAKGGGRHTQAAAQRIHQYLDDYVKIKNLAPRHRDYHLADVEGVEERKNPVTGELEKQQEYRDLSDPSYHGPKVWTKMGSPVKEKGEYLPADNFPGVKRETRKNGTEIEEKVYEVKPGTTERTGRVDWKKVGTQPEGGASGGGKQKEAYIRKKVGELIKARQTVDDKEKYYGGNQTITQWRTDLMKDPEAVKVLAAGSDYTADQLMQQMLEKDANKKKDVERLKEVRAYDKALADKESLEKELNGMGIAVDWETGEPMPVSPKAKKTAAKAPEKEDSGVTHDYVPGKGLVPRAAR